MKYVKMVTFGCQMNKADSEHMLGLLGDHGYQATDSLDQAHLIVFNTCTIRENAVDKLAGHLGELKTYKRVRPDIVVGVAGCVPQHEGAAFLERFPQIDILIGTHNYHKLPELLANQMVTKTAQVLIEQDGTLPEGLSVMRQGSGVTAWVNVSQGCNFACSYCIVPTVRGKEISRQPEAIVEEVRALVHDGYKEVTLLGQTVNSYGRDIGTSLAELMVKIDRTGIQRLKFVTSHPLFMTKDLIEAVHQLPSACEYFHLPIQAGNNEVLRRMRRGYTVERYAKIRDEILSRMPEATLTTDLIVGFPGETEEQFLDTCEVVRQFQFDVSNTASYSPREGTEGAKWDNQIPEEEKHRRLLHLNQVVEEVARAKNSQLVGTVQEVLIEGPNPKFPDQWTGRTRGHKLVHFPMQGGQPGDLVPVTITRATPWSLLGEARVSATTLS